MGTGMLADRILPSVKKENGTDPADINIPVAAVLNSEDGTRIRELIDLIKQVKSARVF